jgi:hypothetical protein
VRTIIAALALATASCGATKDARTFVAECPGQPDACTKAAEEHCRQGGYSLIVADAGEPSIMIRSLNGDRYARGAAEAGYLRLRCVASAIADPGP